MSSTIKQQSNKTLAIKKKPHEVDFDALMEGIRIIIDGIIKTKNAFSRKDSKNSTESIGKVNN